MTVLSRDCNDSVERTHAGATSGWGYLSTAYRTVVPRAQHTHHNPHNLRLPNYMCLPAPGTIRVNLP